MAATLSSLASGYASGQGGGGSSGGSGGGVAGLYSASNQSAVSTPVTTTAGNIGAQNFNLGSLGIGNSQGGGVPSWAIMAVLALLAVMVIRK
jgi:hypothetical protein